MLSTNKPLLLLLFIIIRIVLMKAFWNAAEHFVIFSRPRSQFFTIRTSQPANNIYLFHKAIRAPCIFEKEIRLTY